MFSQVIPVSGVKGDVTVEFAYDHNGLRTQKKVTENGVTTTTNYTLHGKLITHMAQGSNSLHFYYDANSRPAMVDFNGTKYTYVHNLQGDIVVILDTAGSIVVEYKYDAWGRIIATTGSKSTTLGKLNPFRYRGYVYDEETQTYYVSSRFFSPAISRFLNPDCFTSIGRDILCSNMFAYCFNNPIYYIDETGEVPQAAIDRRIHDEVLFRIGEKCSNLSYTKTCIYYNGKNIWGGWGFCDLYDEVTGEVWELKKISNSRSCKTKNASKQLDKYINGRLKRDTSLPLTRPYTPIVSGNFSLKLDGYKYDVDYWDEGNGILRYEYVRQKTELRRQVEETVVVIALVAFVSIVAPSAIPWLIPSLAY